jgi:hypothetical protein
MGQSHTISVYYYSRNKTTRQFPIFCADCHFPHTYSISYPLPGLAVSPEIEYDKKNSEGE